MTYGYIIRLFEVNGTALMSLKKFLYILIPTAASIEKNKAAECPRVRNCAKNLAAMSAGWGNTNFSCPIGTL